MAEQETGLNITKEELGRIQNALKNEEFRKLFAQYANDLSDPENKKKYEEEIAQLEAERGMDVKFVFPQDGFVVKTGIKSEGGKKAFINICQSEAIAEASSEFVKTKLHDQSVSGQQWSIPYSLNQPKEDTDKAAKKCVVYDVIFNTKTYQMVLEDPRFKKLIIDTALDSIETKWNIKLDRKNLKYPKLKFKGSKQSTIIRSSNDKGSIEPGADIEVGDNKLPYPYKEKSTVNKENPSKTKHVATPKYSIVHRGLLDLQNFTNARDCRASTRPQELVVNIDLPLCESSTGIDLDIFEKQLILNSTDPLYHLDISLPYPINENDGGAKFDKTKRRLIVSLAVVPSPPCEQMKHADNDDVNCHVPTAEPEDPSSLASSETRGLNDHDEVNDNGNGCVGTGSEMNGVETGLEDAFANSCEGNMVVVGNDVTEVDEEVLAGSNTSKPDIACPFFKTPSYSFHQDRESVTFIVHVPNVSIDSTSLGFNENMCYINFPLPQTPSPSVASQEYALYVQFPDNCLINSDKSKIDANENNLVLILFKQESCVGLWDRFMIGSDDTKLEKKLFLTEATLKEALKQGDDIWAGPSPLVTGYNVEKLSEDEVAIRLEVRSPQTSQSSSEMGNFLTSAEELLADGEVQSTADPDRKVNNILNAKDFLSSFANLSMNKSNDGVETGDDRREDCDVFDPPADGVGLDYGELDEVEAVEEKYEETFDDEAHHSLSTVQEVDSPGGRKNQEVAGDAELQRARAIKCKRNRRRRRRSTGSHESSSSISEEEGEPGAGRRQRGKHARRLRKTRSLSLGSSAESYDDAESGSHSNGQRSVRFNLVPEVHLFSNKADKKKWKELRKQQSYTEHEERTESTAEKSSCQMKSSLRDGTSKYETTNGPNERNSTGDSSDDVGNSAASKTDVSHPEAEASVNGDTSCSDYDPEKPHLTNSLMFDLDE